MTKTKKEKWIEIEHQKAVQVHWDNLGRIRDLDAKISKATRTIAFIQKSMDLLENTKFQYDEMDSYSQEEERIFAKCDHTPYWEHDSNARIFSGNYDVGIEELHTRQKQLCVDVAKWQQEIDKRPFDASVAIMDKDGDKEMLAEKYEKLFKKEVV